MLEINHLCIVIFAAVITVIGIIYGYEQNDSPLHIKFHQSETKYVRVDEQVDVTCEINRPLQFVIDHSVEYLLKSARGEVTIAQVIKSVSTSNYSTNISRVQGNGIAYHLYILNVTDLFDGQLICRARQHMDSGGVVVEEAGLGIVILRPVETLYLKIDGMEPISEDFVDPVGVYTGIHSVACVAGGSNPAAHVRLRLNDIEVENVEIKAEKNETMLTKFRTTLITPVTIRGLKSQQELQCVASSRFGDERKVKLSVKINTYDPEINCNDTSAKKGQKSVVLSCTVDFSAYSDLDITSFRYSIGIGHRKYSAEGNHNNKFVVVFKEKLSDTKVRVHLMLTEAKDLHFEKEIYILVSHSDGRVTRESVRLHQVADNNASWSVSQSGTILIAIVVMRLLSN